MYNNKSVTAESQKSKPLNKFSLGSEDSEDSDDNSSYSSNSNSGFKK